MFNRSAKAPQPDRLVRWLVAKSKYLKAVRRMWSDT